MLRVGFFLNLFEGWLGGVNYYRNLLTAICDNLSKDIYPVVFLVSKNNDVLDGFPSVEVVRDSTFERFKMRWFMRKLNERFFDKNFVLEKLLIDNNIDLLSHSSFFGGPRSCLTVATESLPVIGWIPDFQHIHLADIFSEKEIRERDRGFREVCRKSSTVLLSSKSAQKDLALFAPGYYHKSRVLRFVVKPFDYNNLSDQSELENRYKFSGPYFYLPNQFWLHKNHSLVVNALKILKDRGKKVTIIVTGKKGDYRNLNYYEQLLSNIKNNNLLESFHILGMVPYQHMASLMYHSIAVINPSFFEGWSTTVEEAKSYGKRVILSDICVHREQSPENAVYFDPRNAEDLSDILWNVWNAYDLNDDKRLRKKAAEIFPKRWSDFAEKYLALVMESKFNNQTVKK